MRKMKKFSVGKKFFHSIDGIPTSIEISLLRSHRAKNAESVQFKLPELARHLASHQYGEKHGPCWSPIIFRRGRRRTENALSVSLLVFDCDRGQPNEEIIENLERTGIAGIISSSYSTNSTKSYISKKTWNSWRRRNPSRQIEDFLLAQGFHEALVKSAYIYRRNGKIFTKRIQNRAYIVVKHPPCPKYRLTIFPDRPIRLDDFGSISQFKTDYKSLLLNVGEWLELNFDKSATDLARVFFDPRISKGSRAETAFVSGAPLKTRVRPPLYGPLFISFLARVVACLMLDAGECGCTV